MRENKTFARLQQDLENCFRTLRSLMIGPVVYEVREPSFSIKPRVHTGLRKVHLAAEKLSAGSSSPSGSSCDA